MWHALRNPRATCVFIIQTASLKWVAPLQQILRSVRNLHRVNIVSSAYDSSEDDSSDNSSSVVISSDDSDSDDSPDIKCIGTKTKDQKKYENKSELDDLPPIEDLKISVPEVLCDPLGEVAWMVEQLVVVRPNVGLPTLNIDTVLFIEKGQRTLGKIFDVFGQVNEPHYCVRFNSSEHIKESDIKVGMKVYFWPNSEHTSLVFLHELMKLKGIDAAADEPPEFSDDEEEQAYYAKLKQKETIEKSDTGVSAKRQQTSSATVGWKSNHPWNQSARSFERGGHCSNWDNRQFTPAFGAGYYPNSNWANNWPVPPSFIHPTRNEQFGNIPYDDSSFQNLQQNNATLFPGFHNQVQCSPRFPPGNPPFNQNTWARWPRPRLPMQFPAPQVSLPLPPPPPGTT